MFWSKDPVKVLFDPSNMMSFIPVLGYDALNADTTEQLNALMRLAIYFSILMLLLGKYNTAIFALLIGAGFTWAVHQSYSTAAAQKELYGSDVKGGCRAPNKANPFMNPMPYDDTSIPGACDIEDQDVRRKMNSLFDENLFRDVSDVFQSQSSDRQYYTVPVTTVPNDQTGFAKWLYDVGPTCKENQLRCNGKYNETY